MGALDLRALALLRISLGALLLVDLVQRWALLDAYYTDLGVLPLHAWVELFQHRYPWRPSFHAISGAALFQHLLFVAAAISALSLALGYRTRVASFASWLLLTSLHNRNPLVLIGGDEQLRLILFFGSFLPWDRRIGWDAKLYTSSASGMVRNAATLAYSLQVAVIYLCSVLLKRGAPWHEERSAIYYVLSFGDHAAPLGRWLLQYPELLSAMTPAVLIVESVAVAIPFLPVSWGRVRAALVLAIVLLHAGFVVFLNIGLFPLVSMAAWLAFLPPWFFQKISGWARVEPADADAAPPPGSSRLARLDARAMTLLCVSSIAYVLAVNIQTLDSDLRLVPGWLRPAGQLLRLDQRWNLFAPAPRRDDGWFVVPAKLMNGTSIDALSLRPVSWDRSPDSSDQPASWLWYLRKIRRKENGAHRRLFADYLCSRWSSVHAAGEAMSDLALLFVLETTPPPGEPAGALKKRVLLEHLCEPLTASSSR